MSQNFHEGQRVYHTALKKWGTIERISSTTLKGDDMVTARKSIYHVRLDSGELVPDHGAGIVSESEAAQQ
jgi:hypothetical protein